MRALVIVAVLAGCGPRGVPGPPDPEIEHADEHAPGYVHGMLVFGGAHTTYFSHLPLFQAPHDYQIVLAVTLSADGADPAAARLADQTATGERLYTFAPAPFALHHAGEPGYVIHGDLVHGHFERGGPTLIADVDATVDRVLHFRRFEPDAAAEPLTYLLVGDGHGAYLVHHLTAPPDFDQVLTVAALPASIDVAALAAGVLVQFPDHPADAPLVPGEHADAVVAGVAGRHSLEIGGETYLERGELAN